MNALAERTTLVELKKNDWFLRSGETCKKVGLLVKGVFRVFYFSNDKEHTSYFNIETRNPFVSAFTSFLTQAPSMENIQALEDCSYYTLSYDSLQDLYVAYSDFERFGRILAERNYLMAMDRIYDLQQQKADYKYEKFMELYPGLMNRIPHHYISSYLGITPESLSRIRRKK